MKVVFIFLLILFPDSLRAEEESFGFQTSNLGACPKTENGWLDLARGLSDSEKITDLLAAGELAEQCEARPEARELLRQPKVAACFRGLRDLARFAVESSAVDSSILSPQKSAPPEAVSLPKTFRDETFWIEIGSRDPARAEKAILRATSELPGAVAFSYLSVLQPKTPLFLVHFQEEQTGLERFVHFDQELNVNLLSISSDPKPRFYFSHLSRPEIIQHPRNLGEAVQKGDISTHTLNDPILTNSARCLRCHQSPVLPIFPLDSGSAKTILPPPSHREAIAWFNENTVRTESTGISAIAGKIPALGAPAALDPHFLEQCSGMKDKKNLSRLRDGLRCVACHDDKIMPRLAFPFGNPALVENGSVIADLAFDQEVDPNIHTMAAVPQVYVEKGYMPPDLASIFGLEERKALFRCLMTEYLGRLYPQRPPALFDYQGRLIRTLLKDCGSRQQRPARKRKGPPLRGAAGPKKR
jgi:hypothetical protein